MGFSISVGIVNGENEDKKVKGLASVVIDNSFKINNIAIVDGGEKKGLFVAMPALKVNEQYREVCHPVKRDFREELYNKILTTYAVASASENRTATFSTVDTKDEPDVAVWAATLIKDSNSPALKGTANIVLNNNFIVENMPIRENKEGEVFLAMPSYRKKTTGEFHDIVHPVTKEFREKLQQAVLEKYEKAKDMEVNLLDGKEDSADMNKSATKGAWEAKIKNQKDVVPDQEQKTDMHKGNFER